MFEATLKDREHSFRVAPGTSMFIHWLVGMVYIFYFASFILLLREVLRPGVLWFLRNLNDPDFNPIQEVSLLPHSNVLTLLTYLSCDERKYSVTLVQIEYHSTGIAAFSVTPLALHHLVSLHWHCII